MTTRSNWITLKFGLKQGLIKDIQNQNRPNIRAELEQYIEGRINLRCSLIRVMQNMERGIALDHNIKEFIKIKEEAIKKAKVRK